jgi:hypothetical protein
MKGHSVVRVFRGNSTMRWLIPLFSVLTILLMTLPVAAFSSDMLVTVGSPTSPFTQNKQNEPAIAVDANHPNILAAGSNDEIDLEACNAGDPTTCPFTPGVGTSGIYFSFDSGTSWTQPTYAGWTARQCIGAPGFTCTPGLGPIGTLPKYFESGLVSGGDPALAFGPRPGPGGMFSWSNGERLYYANLTANFSTIRSEEAFKGFEAVTVSRTDDVAAAAASNVSAWMAPVIVSKQNAVLFSDKDQIWADNAASSPFFGHVYICNVAFRSQEKGRALPSPLMVDTSTDGGDTWTQKQVTPAVDNIKHFGVSGCSIRTDSHGVVSLLGYQFAFGFPGFGSHFLIRSFDGGMTWTRPQTLFTAVDLCNAFDPVQGRCVEDGVAGARDDLAPEPNVDIANGAPTGADATNEIVDTWVDGRAGLNHEHIFLAYSTDGGVTWIGPTSIEQPGDRGYYTAPGISPNGTDLYVVENAFLTPYRTDTTSSRILEGIVLHADIGAGGTPTGWTVLHRSPPGDPRGSSANSLISEFLGDYVYAVATRTYGAVVWNDARNAADCPKIDAYRMSLQTGGSVARPAPNVDCPATFGNSDIFGGSYLNPTP